MITLRSYLGAHPGHRRGQLMEREAVMLIVCAGRRAGFTVKTEISVPTKNRNGLPVRGEIDVGWYAAGRLAAVWEIDGQDAGEAHFRGHPKKGTAGNTAKFSAADAPFKVQVLYSLKNNLDAKGPSKHVSIQHWLDGVAFLVTDEELMNTQGIEAWTEKIGARVR